MESIDKYKEMEGDGEYKVKNAKRSWYYALPFVLLSMLPMGCSTTHTHYEFTPPEAIEYSLKKFNSPYVSPGSIEKRNKELYKRIKNASDELKKRYERKGEGLAKIQYWDKILSGVYRFYGKKSQSKEDAVIILRKDELVPYRSPFSEEYDRIWEAMYGAQFVELKKRAKEWYEDNEIYLRHKEATVYWDNESIYSLVYHFPTTALGVYKVNIRDEKIGKKKIGTMYVFAVQPQDKAKISSKVKTNIPVLRGIHAFVANLIAIGIADPYHTSTMLELATGESVAEGAYSYVAHELGSDGGDLNFYYLPFDKAQGPISGINGLLGDITYTLRYVSPKDKGMFYFIRDEMGNVYIVRHNAKEGWNIYKADNAVILYNFRYVKDRHWLNTIFRGVLEGIGLRAVKEQVKGRSPGGSEASGGKEDGGTWYDDDSWGIDIGGSVFW